MKHTKLSRLLALLLAALLTFSLTACGDIESTVETAGEIIEIADQAMQMVDEINAMTDESQSETNVQQQTPPLESAPAESEQNTEPDQSAIDEFGSYYSKDDVALYIHTYGHLPGNYITKSEARDLGWEGGSVEIYAEGCAIGGDKFGNYEGLLPKADGRTYTECDIDTDGGQPRGAKRIIFSNDGLIYYTDDHYESFELLYGEE